MGVCNLPQRFSLLGKACVIRSYFYRPVKISEKYSLTKKNIIYQLTYYKRTLNYSTAIKPLSTSTKYEADIAFRRICTVECKQFVYNITYSALPTRDVLQLPAAARGLQLIHLLTFQACLDLITIVAVIDEQFKCMQPKLYKLRCLTI